MPGDIVSGRYPLTNQLWSWLGQPTNATQSNVPAQTNLVGGAPQLIDSTSALASGVATAVAVPVDLGIAITAVDVIVGATAASTPTHAWVALYSAPTAAGTPKLVGTQSVDGATTAIAASGRFSFTLPSYLTNATDSPTGYLYVAVCVTGTATPSLVSYTVPTAVAFPWYANSPAKMGAFTSGTALGATAPASLTPAAQAVTPVVFLR
jgi:hypothetical protein